MLGFVVRSGARGCRGAQRQRQECGGLRTANSLAAAVGGLAGVVEQDAELVGALAHSLGDIAGAPVFTSRRDAAGNATFSTTQTLALASAVATF